MSERGLAAGAQGEIVMMQETGKVAELSIVGDQTEVRCQIALGSASDGGNSSPPAS